MDSDKFLKDLLVERIDISFHYTQAEYNSLLGKYFDLVIQNEHKEGWLYDVVRAKHYLILFDGLLVVEPGAIMCWALDYRMNRNVLVRGIKLYTPDNIHSEDNCQNKT